LTAKLNTTSLKGFEDVFLPMPDGTHKRIGGLSDQEFYQAVCVILRTISPNNTAYTRKHRDIFFFDNKNIMNDPLDLKARYYIYIEIENRVPANKRPGLLYCASTQKIAS
jgi:hypothetical protein